MKSRSSITFWDDDTEVKVTVEFPSNIECDIAEMAKFAADDVFRWASMGYVP